MGCFEDIPRHSEDDRMLLFQGKDDIPFLGDDRCKGAIWQNAFPPAVMEEFLNLSDEKLRSVSGQVIKAGHHSGNLTLNKAMCDVLSWEAKHYIQGVSQAFNQVADWPVEFLIQNHLGLHQVAKGFHLDSKSGTHTRQFRGFINISSPSEDRDHETEWVVANDLSRDDLKALMEGHADKPIKDLPEIFRTRVRTVRSGDMFLTKGLGDRRYINYKTDGPVHRAPPFKNTYPEEGKRRVALIWQRAPAGNLDFD